MSVVKFEPQGSFMGNVLVEITPVAKGPRTRKVMFRGHALSGVLRSPDDQFQSFSMIMSSGDL